MQPERRATGEADEGSPERPREVERRSGTRAHVVATSLSGVEPRQGGRCERRRDPRGRAELDRLDERSACLGPASRAQLEISERGENPRKSARRTCSARAVDRALGDLAPTGELLVPRVRLHEECDRVLRRGRLEYRAAVPVQTIEPLDRIGGARISGEYGELTGHTSRQRRELGGDAPNLLERLRGERLRSADLAREHECRKRVGEYRKRARR